MSGQIKIKVNGQAQSIDSDQKPTHLFEDDAKIVVCKINGELRDLWSDLNDGDQVESVSIDSPDGLNVLRHSTAHVLAQAVQEVYPETKLGIGPPIRDGFYYDFDPREPFTPSDLEKLETAMRKIINQPGPGVTRAITPIIVTAPPIRPTRIRLAIDFMGLDYQVVLLQRHRLNLNLQHKVKITSAQSYLHVVSI